MPTNHLSRRSVLGAGLAGSLGLFLSSCGFGRQEQAAGVTTLSVWDSFTTEPVNGAVNALGAAYAAGHGGTTIDRNIVQYDQLTALAKTAMASGDGPDLVYYSVGKGNAGVLVEAGLLAPLDDLAGQAGWRDSIAPYALREATFDGVLYGLPNESEISGWWYNKSLLDQHGLAVPETVDDLLALTTAAKGLGIVPVAYGQGDIYTSYWLFSQIACNVLQSDALGKLVYENAGAWNTPEIVQAIQTVFVDLHQAGTFGENVNALKASDAMDMWTAEQAFLLVNGSWATGTLAQALPEREIGMMPLPSLAGEHRVYSAGSGGAYWLSASSKQPDAAKEFLRWAFSDEAVRIWVEQAQLVPPVEFDASGWQTTPLQQRVSAAAAGDGDPERNLGYQVNHGLAAAPFLNMMTEGFQAIVAGDKTPQQQADDLQAAWAEGLA